MQENTDSVPEGAEAVLAQSLTKGLSMKELERSSQL